MVREQIVEGGPLAYAEVIERALYDPEHGFYSTGGRAGRRGDFLTSPEVGPLFGHVVANALDAEWDRLGQPELFTVVDYGAGPGTLARGVLAAHPRCEAVLRYVAVEQSVTQRADHPQDVLSVEQLAVSDLGGAFDGVIIANELLDNMAFTPVTRIEGELRPVEVGLTDRGELATTPSMSDERYEHLFDPSLHDGVVQAEAAGWLDHARSALSRGRVIAIDYARQRSAEVEVRTYLDHELAGDPLDQLGRKDITVDVDLEQLQRVAGSADQISTQSAWLEGHGISALVEEGRTVWRENAAIGDLASLRLRSRIREAEALLDPEGLGGFTVAEWIVGEDTAT